MPITIQHGERGALLDVAYKSGLGQYRTRKEDQAYQRALQDDRIAAQQEAQALDQAARLKELTTRAELGDVAAQQEFERQDLMETARSQRALDLHNQTRDADYTAQDQYRLAEIERKKGAIDNAVATGIYSEEEGSRAHQILALESSGINPKFIPQIKQKTAQEEFDSIGVAVDKDGNRYIQGRNGFERDPAQLEEIKTKAKQEEAQTKIKNEAEKEGKKRKLEEQKQEDEQFQAILKADIDAQTKAQAGLEKPGAVDVDGAFDRAVKLQKKMRALKQKRQEDESRMKLQKFQEAARIGMNAAAQMQRSQTIGGQIPAESLDGAPQADQQVQAEQEERVFLDNLNEFASNYSEGNAEVKNAIADFAIGWRDKTPPIPTEEGEKVAEEASKLTEGQLTTKHLVALYSGGAKVPKTPAEAAAYPDGTWFIHPRTLKLIKLVKRK